MKVKMFFAVAAVASVAVSGQAFAAPLLTSFDAPVTTVGGSYNLGYQFRADRDLEITDLGFYDAQGNGLSSNHTVSLYALNGTLLGSTIVGASGTLVGDFRYSALASAVNLVAGTSYRLAGTTSGSDPWVYQGSNIAMSGATYQVSYYTGTGFPSIVASDRQYLTVNALASAVNSAVPEPATWAMMLIGFGAIGATMRRRKTSARIQFA